MLSRAKNLYQRFLGFLPAQWVLVCASILLNLLGEIFYDGQQAAGITPNQVVRLLSMLCLLFSIRKRASVQKVLAIAGMLLLCYLSWMFSGSSLRPLYDLVFMSKQLYAFLSYFAMYELLEQNIGGEKKLSNCYSVTALVISIGIMVALVGVGNRAYADDRHGLMGIFFGGNAVTAYLLIVVPILFMALKGWRRVVLLGLCSVALVLTGSKAGIILLVFEVGALFLFFLLFRSFLDASIIGAKARRKRLILLCTVAAVLVAGGVVFFIMERERFFEQGFYDSLYSFLVSNRDEQVNAVYQYSYHARSLSANLFGFGYTRLEQVLNHYHYLFYAIEQDFFAIFYYFGLFYTVLLYGFILTTLVKAVLLFHRDRNLGNCCVALSMVVMLIFSFFGGHVLIESINIPLAFTLMAYVNRRYKNRYNKGLLTDLLRKACSLYLERTEPPDSTPAKKRSRKKKSPAAPTPTPLTIL